MLYALTERPGGNRSTDVLGQPVIVRLVFPLTTLVPLSVNLPDAEQHQNRTANFTWSTDSFFVFADYGEGAFSIVLVRVDTGVPQVSRRTLRGCPGKGPEESPRTTDVAISGPGDARQIVVKLQPSLSASMLLQLGEFSPVKVKHLESLKTAPTIITERPSTLRRPQ
jgi:hypothetical protein